MKRVFYLAYGLGAFGAAGLISVYQIGFISGYLVPKSINQGGKSTSFGLSVLIDLLLLGLFGAQHSFMARPWFKRILTKVVPGALERSTYVWMLVLVYGLLFWQWRPIPIEIWHVDNVSLVTLIWTVFVAGWLLLLWSSHLIDPLSVWGLRQVWAAFRGGSYKISEYQVCGPYLWIRHPIMLGLFMVFWAAPVMTVGHAIFAGVMTTYGLVATRWEERDLIRDYPEYDEYRKSTPMIVPRLGHGEEKITESKARI